MGAFRIHSRIRHRAVARLADRPDPALEPEGWGNCWTWALAHWLRHGGCLVVVNSEYIPVWRACWAPNCDDGPLWHFHPTTPRKGLAGIWAAIWHKGRPKNLR